MRKFFYKLMLGVSGLYLCLTIIFSYELLISEVPDQVYVTEGEAVDINVEFPLVMTEKQICSLFGVIPIKEIEVNVVDEQTVYACGKIIGIYTETQGVFVIDTCEIETKNGDSKNPAGSLVHTGDYILAINGEEVDNKEEMVDLVSGSGGKELTLSILRGEENVDVKVSPVLGKNGKYMLGIWVKDDQAGVGTMTYFTDTGEFGALGHGMGNGENGELLVVDGGKIYNSKIAGIEKGMVGSPGEIKGVIYYGSGNCLGELDTNCSCGIFGELDMEDLIEYMSGGQSYKVAHKQEIRRGNAQILSEISGKLELYDIEITYVDYLSIDNNKGLHIEVTDEKLLELTGGIVQGMSGSPIIQNGKLIGAVTHVLINDPKSGYGIFIENMLEY